MDGSVSHTRFPVVLRFEGIHPSDLARIEMHGLRRGGDLGHCDPVKMEVQKRAKPLIGGEDWVSKALTKIEEARVGNFADEMEGLARRKRAKDVERRLIEGPNDPWRATRHGPMRELILTANKHFFNDELAELFNESSGQNESIQQFQERALGWLKNEFGDDVIYARADQDEAAFHIHAVILPMVEVKMTRRHKLPDGTRSEPYVIATRTMLQPSKFAVIEDYEKAQDSVGEWFKEIGLTRGERRKAAFREAIKNGVEPPKKRRHVQTATWRQQEEVRLAAEKARLDREERALEKTKEEAEAIIDFADQIASGQVMADDTMFADVDATQPPKLKSKKPSALGFERARAAFHAAFARMKERAEIKAATAAEAKLAQELLEVRAADEVIVGIAAMLPVGLRTKIADARKSLTAKIMRLDRRTPPNSNREKPSNNLGEDHKD